MNNIVKTTMATVVAATLFTGCSLGEVGNELNKDVLDGNNDGGNSSYNDTLSVSKTVDGFIVHWTKRASGYGEVIYTDGTRGPRGNGYPLTSNSTGSFSLDCHENYNSSADRVSYNCEASNFSGADKHVILDVGTQYQWLVSYGTDHEYGEAEAIMEYNGGTLSIQ